MTGGSLANVNFLIVDDSPHIRRLVTTMLRGMGAQHLHEAKDSTKALDLLERVPVDVALVDWMLDDGTGRTGMDVVWHLRRSPIEQQAFLPVIMMSGHTERQNIELARDTGVTEFLAKPFTARSLFQRLQTLVESPRPFVKTRSYFGPDRRRRSEGPGEDGERRFVNPRRGTET
jgi:CheY-like chemotaxis protein